MRNMKHIIFIPIIYSSTYSFKESIYIQDGRNKVQGKEIFAASTFPYCIQRKIAFIRERERKEKILFIHSIKYSDALSLVESPAKAAKESFRCSLIRKIRANG